MTGNTWSLEPVVMALLCTLSLAQTAIAMEKSEDIDTNRPSFMFSPLVVPRGSLQLENGSVFQNLRSGINFVDVPET